MIKNIFLKAAGVLCHPPETFRKIKDETFRDSVNYYLVLFAINLVLSAVITFRLGEMDMKALTDPKALSILGKALIAIGYVGFIRSLFIGTIGLVVFGILFHILVSRAGGKKELKTTLSVVMFSLTPPLLTGWLFNLILASFNWLPNSVTTDTGLLLAVCLYLLIMFVYTMALLYYGTRELQEISSEQASNLVQTTAVVLFVFAFFATLFLAAASWGAGMMNSFETMKPH